MKSIAIAATVTAVAAVGHQLSRPAFEGGAGISYGSTDAPVRDRDVDFNIWFPVLVGGRQIMVGGNGVFYGTPAGRKAPHVEGRHHFTRRGRQCWTVWMDRI